MKFKILFGWMLFTLSVTEGSIFNKLGYLMKEYKKTSLRFREDMYQNNLPILKSYDFVIVGASPAGCALASRLTENPKVSVLLLEAGPEGTEYSNIPSMNLLLLMTEYNWHYNSQYNPRVCRAMENGTCPWPSGRGVGGGSMMNGMIYTRGHKEDFDSWARAGNTGWSFQDVLKYFKRLEDVRIPELRGSDMRGRGGMVSVEHSSFRTNGSLIFLEAGMELGYPIIDYNVPYPSGFAKLQATLDNGRRLNAANAYLRPVKWRKNLHVVQRATVLKVLIDSRTKVAVGVEFMKKSVKRVVKAKREVILSAGAFGSPRLLMLSGIGHRSHLESLGIDVIQDLPVGDNLQEHIGSSSVVFLTNVSNFNFHVPYYLFRSPKYFFEYQLMGRGPFAAPGCDSLAYLKSKYAKTEAPDIELLFIGGSYNSDYGTTLRRTIGVRDDIYNAYWKRLENKYTFSIWVMGGYPKSRGTVRLASRNPFDPPLIDNNFLNDPEDLAVVVEGIKKTVQLAETNAMKSYGVEVYKRQLPGCENFEFGKDEYWECVVRQITAQFHHQCGTCKMGPDGDPTSVVDPRLRVRGVQGLRVVDVSIMPTITGGHTMAPAYMIGEKAADMIKEDHSLF